MGSDPTVSLGWDSRSLEEGSARAAHSVAEFDQKATHSLNHLSDVSSEALAFVGIGASIEGVKSLVEEFGKFDAMSRELNESPEAMQRLSYLAQENSTDVQTLTKDLQKFGVALRDTSNDAAQSALKELNIDAAEFIRLSPEQQLVALTEAYQAAERSGSGLVAVHDLLGKSFSSLLPILRGNVDAVRELASAPVLSADQVKTLHDFGDGWTRVVNTQKVQLAQFALTAVGFAKAIGGALTEGGLFNFNGDNFAKGFNRVAQAQKNEATTAQLAAEATRQMVREMAATKEEADRADSAYKKFTKTIADQVEQHERLADRIRALEGTLDGIHLNLGQGPDQQLEAAQRHLEAINAQIQQMQSGGSGGAADDEAILKVQVEQKHTLNDILNLEQRIHDVKDAQTKKANEQRDAQLTAIRSLEADTAVLSLRASGHNKAADAMERQLKIQEEAHRIAKATGVSEADALTVAQKRADLEDRANQRKNNPHAVHGYSRDQRDSNAFIHASRLDAFKADAAIPFFQAHPTDFGSTRHAAAADRAANVHGRTRDLQPEILRILTQMDQRWAGALN